MIQSEFGSSRFQGAYEPTNLLFLLNSFSRRLETVNFFSTLKVVLPRGWDVTVQTAVFDILLGRLSGPTSPTIRRVPTVACPQVLPSILAVVEARLQDIVDSDDSAGASGKCLTPH